MENIERKISYIVTGIYRGAAKTSYPVEVIEIEGEPLDSSPIENSATGAVPFEGTLDTQPDTPCDTAQETKRKSEMDFPNWRNDSKMAKRFLMYFCNLEMDKYYRFCFDDGTGFAGTPFEFVPIMIRQFERFPDDCITIVPLETMPETIFPPERAVVRRVSDYPNWRKDPEIARRYLLEYCELKMYGRYVFYFDDGTYFVGDPIEFLPFMIRQFEKMPDDFILIVPIDYTSDAVAGADLIANRDRKSPKDYKDWYKDPEMARRYLLEYCDLNEDAWYGFYFEDGTGFVGQINGFIPYMIRRFKKFPNDSFEIDFLGDPCHNDNSYELYPPTYEGEECDPYKQDPRF